MKPIIALAVAAFFAAPLSAQQFTIFASGGKSMTSYHGQSDVQSFNLEWARRRWKQTDAGIVLGSEFVWQPVSWYGGRDHSPKEKVRALNAALVLRHHLQSHPAVYAELSSGPMWSEKQVPAATSRFNFLSQGGLGYIVRSHSSMPVMIGIRFAHISNAGIAHHNPGINFTAIVMGVRFRP